MLQHYVQCGSASSRNNSLLLGLFNNCWLKAAFRNTGRFIKLVQIVPWRTGCGHGGDGKERAEGLQTCLVCAKPHSHFFFPLYPRQIHFCSLLASLYFFSLLKSHGIFLLNHVFGNSTSSQQQTATVPITLVLLSSL